MQWSKYNLLFKSSRHTYLIYNSLTNFFAELDEDAFKELEKIRKAPASYDFTRDPALYVQLATSKVLVEEGEEADLIRQIHLQRLRDKFDNSSLSLTIAPTMACNFACPYCYQRSHRSIHMTKETEDQLINFIRTFKPLAYLQIEWFGGEPLLRFASMCRLSMLIDGLQIPWAANLVSNCYLLDDHVISRLTELHINTLQVTIDGPEEIHNVRRPLASGKPTYQTILANLDRLMNKWDGHLAIRMNIDKKNQTAFLDTRNQLHQRFAGKRVTVSAGIVLGTMLGLPGDPCHFDRDDRRRFRLESYSTYATNACSGTDDFEFYPRPAEGCFATHVNGFVVGPQGEVYKCYSDLGIPDRVVGSVYEGQPWNMALLSKYLLADVFDDAVCRDCFYLPLCNGGCVAGKLKTNLECELMHRCVEYKDVLPKWLETCWTTKQRGTS